MGRRMVLWAGLWLLGLPSLVFSAGESIKAPDEYVLDEVVVTATKTKEKRRDVPNAVIVVEEEEIEESPAKTVGELLADDPGLDWRTYGDYGGAAELIHIRGMDSNATQVRLNGVGINSPSLGLANLAMIPLNALERIEVVKGSGSLLYGSGAMGGTINLTTKSPSRDRAAFRATAGAGSQASYRLEAEQGMFVSENLGYYVTARALKTHGFRSNSDMTHKDATLKLLYDRGEALSVSLYGDYITREYGRPGVQPPPGTSTYVLNGVAFFNDESASLLDRGWDADSHLILNLLSKPTSWLDLDLRADYSLMENYNLYRSAFDGTGARTWVTNRVFGAEGDATLRPFEGASLLLGTEYRAISWENENRNLDAGGGDLPETYTKVEATLHTVGTYAEGQYRLNRYIKGLAGLRRERNSQFGTEYLPRYGLVLNPLKQTVVKVNSGRHFLAPTPNDLYWPEGPWVKGNPDLKPETGWHTDVTLEQELMDGRLFAGLSYFFWDVKNKIVWAPDANWIYTPQNLDKYRGKGIEAQVKAGPFEGFTLDLAYTYLNAEEENPDVTRRAPYTPRHLFKAELAYKTRSGLSASLVERYVGERPYYGGDTSLTTPAYILDGYWTTDMKISQRIKENWILCLEGYNLLDKDYGTYLGAFTDPRTWETTVSPFPGAGRAVFFSVTYEY